MAVIVILHPTCILLIQRLFHAISRRDLIGRITWNFTLFQSVFCFRPCGKRYLMLNPASDCFEAQRVSITQDLETLNTKLPLSIETSL